METDEDRRLIEALKSEGVKGIPLQYCFHIARALLLACSEKPGLDPELESDMLCIAGDLEFWE